MSVKNSSGGQVQHGSKTVGTTAEVMTAAQQGSGMVKGVLIKAASANTGIVYVGSPNVTAAADDTNTGFPLSASESIFIPAEDLNLWIVGSAASQKVFWLAR